jgi:hypothetical protein
MSDGRLSRADRAFRVVIAALGLALLLQAVHRQLSAEGQLWLLVCGTLFLGVVAWSWRRKRQDREREMLVYGEVHSDPFDRWSLPLAVLLLLDLGPVVGTLLGLLLVWIEREQRRRSAAA